MVPLEPVPLESPPLAIHFQSCRLALIRGVVAPEPPFASRSVVFSSLPSPDKSTVVSEPESTDECSSCMPTLDLSSNRRGQTAFCHLFYCARVRTQPEPCRTTIAKINDALLIRVCGWSRVRHILRCCFWDWPVSGQSRGPPTTRKPSFSTFLRPHHSSGYASSIMLGFVRLFCFAACLLPLLLFFNLFSCRCNLLYNL